MQVARHFRITQKRELATAFVFYYDAKQPETLRGSSHVSCYLFLSGCGKNGHGRLDHGAI